MSLMSFIYYFVKKKLVVYSENGQNLRSEEVADMVSYLASTEASFVIGANLKINCGFAA
jgi:NAD(P)-dependent dehydrogenase (short-subunit alcohol dehydrogenase family)